MALPNDLAGDLRVGLVPRHQIKKRLNLRYDHVKRRLLREVRQMIPPCVLERHAKGKKHEASFRIRLAEKGDPPGDFIEVA